MTLIDILIIIAVVLVIGNAARMIISAKRKGKTICGGQCAGCMHPCAAKRDKK